jgi:hypothetical protein
VTPDFCSDNPGIVAPDRQSVNRPFHDLSKQAIICWVGIQFQRRGNDGEAIGFNASAGKLRSSDFSIHFVLTGKDPAHTLALWADPKISFRMSSANLIHLGKNKP